MTDRSLNDLTQLKDKALRELEAITEAAQLEEWRVRYVGRKGLVPQLLRTVKNLPAAERQRQGSKGNQLRQALEEAYAVKAGSIGVPTATSEHAENFTLAESPGHLHPLTLTIQRVQDIFSALGFRVVEGPDIEEQKYNFDLLNIAFEHPARTETDTFYIADQQGSDNLPLILRTHVSPLQIRGPRESNLKPPYKIFYCGRTFRSERTDATHESTFHQFEFTVISKKASLAELKSIIENFYSLFFQKKTAIRLRPSFFPFVEPGVEVDISCIFCGGKGCNVCKNTGWIEVAGAGMVHPSVLKNVGIDPKEFQGFALGGAIDRLAMLLYGINDIRLFWSGDIRFLKQFS